MVEMDSDTLSNILSIKNAFSKAQLAEGIKLWPKSLETCVKRSALFKSLQKDARGDTKTALLLQHVESLSTSLEPLLRDATPTEKEGYDQVYFRGTPWSGINSIPFALMILSVSKSYIVPAVGLILPLISCILPYILLRVFYNIPITVTEYTTILWRMWNGQGMPRTPEELFNPPPAPPEDAFTQIRRLAQNAWTIFTLGQTLWQPIQQARHFIKLDGNCLALGECIIDLKETAGELIGAWRRYFPKWIITWIAECPNFTREAFAFVLENPFWLSHTFRGLGRFEVVYRLAKRADIVTTEFINGEEPVLMTKGFGDPSIDPDKRVLSSIRLGGGGSGSGTTVNHSILTGPNRGGKSSFMRGALTNILLSHAFGCAFAEKAQMTHFSWIANGLRLDDTPGKQSMFEREVAFSSSVLQKSGGRGIVLYDELFHSTNPPDAIRSSEIFCNSLWNKKNCVSILSTHVYSLARSAPIELVKPICVAAWVSNDGFKFSYTVQKGVCEVSSVDLVLKQYGLLPLHSGRLSAQPSAQLSAVGPSAQPRLLG